MVPCECATAHDRRRVVLTGGPGAGKTAVLELIRQSFCEHVKVLPEAASVVFGGGFPREDDPECKRAAQRAIFYVQRELENAADGHNPTIVLCDRGTLDGLAYWPSPVDEFWTTLGTTRSEQLARYHAVIHLRTPALDHGYNNQNPLRTESAAAAVEIDERILRAWEEHPRRFVIESTPAFLDKAAEALEILRREMPECCKRHVIGALEKEQLAVQPLLPLILCKERQSLAEACKLLNREFGPAFAVTKEYLHRRFVLRWVECEVLKESGEDGAVARCKCGILRVLPIRLEERAHDGGPPQ